MRADLLLDNDRVEALGVLDVDSLDVAVELLLGALLVVTSSGNADAQSVGDALDTVLPDLLVQGGVDADIGGTLDEKNRQQFRSRRRSGTRFPPPIFSVAVVVCV